MIGTERRRFCGDCQLNVYNLSGMSQREAENLLTNSEGRLCVRFFRRADGTILTKDCPVGWQAVKRRVSRTAAAFASMFFGIIGGLGINGYFTKSRENVVVGLITRTEDGAGKYKTPPVNRPLMGAPEVKGEIAPNYPTAGGISNIEEVRREFKGKRVR